MTLNEIFAYITFVNRQLASDEVPENTKQALCLGIEATLKSLGQYEGYTLTDEDDWDLTAESYDRYYYISSEVLTAEAITQQDDIERSIRAFHKKNNV